MPNYLFVLGNAPELAEEELLSIWPNYPISGGLVKVCEVFDDNIVALLTFGKKPGERITFGVSGDNLVDPVEIKQELEKKGFKARFILPKDGVELSSVVVAKQKVKEIYLIDNIKAKTIWVQDFEGWNRRDYGRPEANAHIGMLPPKVARMMVNVAGSGTILDPFCGVGTILAEGYTTGHKVIGSDINATQLTKTKKNLDWLGAKYDLFLQDARKVSLRFPSGSIDAVVTEPYLGPDNKQRLEELYLSSLSDWRKVLKTKGRVVIALPFVLDKAKIMGYSLVSGPFPYFRPQAKVRRNICVFELKHGSH